MPLLILGIGTGQTNQEGSCSNCAIIIGIGTDQYAIIIGIGTDQYSSLASICHR
jgi:hypothetical protein